MSKRIEEFRPFQIYNKYRKLNFTVTFNPYKFTDSDTIEEGPRIFREQMKLVLNKKGGDDFSYYYVKEQHKNRRYHLHGQIFFENQEVYEKCRFDIFDRLNGLIKKKCGIAVLKWDNGEVDTSKEYHTYLDYCLKEAQYVTYVDRNGVLSTLKVF